MSSRHAALAAHGFKSEMVRGKDGQFKRKKGNQHAFAELCREIVEQPEALEALKAQAKNGVGKGEDQLPPATHKLLVEYGYGLPPRRKDDDEEAMQRMKTMREMARAFIRDNPDEARVIDISAMRAAERLPANAGEDEDDRPAS